MNKIRAETKKNFIGLGTILLVAVGAFLYKPITAEATWAEEHCESTLEVYATMEDGLKYGWFYDRASPYDSNAGPYAIHIQDTDGTWLNWTPQNIATYDAGKIWHTNRGNALVGYTKYTNQYGSWIQIKRGGYNQGGDCVGLTPVVLIDSTKIASPTGYHVASKNTNMSCYDAGSYWVVPVGYRQSGGYIAPVYDPNTNNIIFHDYNNSVTSWQVAKYDNNYVSLNQMKSNRSGYTQVGWCTQGTRYYNYQSEVDNAKQNSDVLNFFGFDTVWENGHILFCGNGTTINMYPVYVANQYTITFNTNASGDPAKFVSSEVTTRTVLYGTANWYARVGKAYLYNGNYGGANYTFTGWYTSDGRMVYDSSGWAVSQPGIWNETGVGGQYQHPNGSYPTYKSWGYAGNITLYAHWSINACYVKYAGNGATSGSMSNQYIYQNVWTHTTGNGYSRYGYDFTKWNTAANGTGTDVANGGGVYTGSDLQLYAQWKAKDFYVACDTNNPDSSGVKSISGGYQTFKATHGQKNSHVATTSAESNASSRGYTFLGYYTAKNGGSMVYDANGNIVANSPYTDAYGNWKYNGTTNATVTLYAHWAVIDLTSVTVDQPNSSSEAILLNGNLGNTNIVRTEGTTAVYAESGNSVYGSCVDVQGSVRSVNGDTAPRITKIWVTATPTADTSKAKTYTLWENAAGVNSTNATYLINTVEDIPDYLSLGYVVYMKNSYGTTVSVTKTDIRSIDVQAMVEKTNQGLNNNTTDNKFSAGTTGVLHIYTAGWVDHFSVNFPDSFTKGWEYDESLGYDVMDPLGNSTFVFDVSESGRWTIKGNVYDANQTYDHGYSANAEDSDNGALITGMKYVGTSGFVRCYDLYFWVPMSIDSDSNPNHIDITDDTNLGDVVICAERETDVSRQTQTAVKESSIVKKISRVSLSGTSVTPLDQIRTVILSSD